MRLCGPGSGFSESSVMLQLSVQVQRFTPVRSNKGKDPLIYTVLKNITKKIDPSTVARIKIQRQVSLWFYDRNTSTTASFITSPYLSQVTLDLGLFTTHQASTTFTESPDRLNLETSALWTASSTVAADASGCHIK